MDDIKAFLVNKIEANFCMKCLEMWTWITKALVLREHKLFTEFSFKVKKSFFKKWIYLFSLKFLLNKVDRMARKWKSK